MAIALLRSHHWRNYRLNLLQILRRSLEVVQWDRFVLLLLIGNVNFLWRNWPNIIIAFLYRHHVDVSVIFNVFHKRRRPLGCFERHERWRSIHADNFYRFVHIWRKLWPDHSGFSHNNVGICCNHFARRNRDSGSHHVMVHVVNIVSDWNVKWMRVLRISLAENQILTLLTELRRRLWVVCIFNHDRSNSGWRRLLHKLS